MPKISSICSGRPLAAIAVILASVVTGVPAQAAPVAGASGTPVAGSDQTAAKVRIAVVDFKAVGASDTTSAAVAENLRNALVRAGKFTVIERGQIQQVMREQQFGQSGLVDESKASEMGKLLGAQVVVVGSLTRLGNIYTINARFVDVTTGAATDEEALKTSDESMLPRLVNRIAARLSGVKWPLHPHKPGRHGKRQS